MGRRKLTEEEKKQSAERHKKYLKEYRKRKMAENPRYYAEASRKSRKKAYMNMLISEGRYDEWKELAEQINAEEAEKKLRENGLDPINPIDISSIPKKDREAKLAERKREKTKEQLDAFKEQMRKEMHEEKRRKELREKFYRERSDNE